MFSGKNYINGEWLVGDGDSITSINPATNEKVYEGKSATEAQVDSAVRAAMLAKSSWSALTFNERASYLEKYTEVLEQNQNELVDLITRENGKPHWEATAEVSGMLSKFRVSVKAYELRCADVINTLDDTTTLATRSKPHGILAVYGPFNFPGHLPHGHIIPSLLAGNTIVFKPSDEVPACGEWLISQWDNVGLPKGVINLVQGGVDVGVALAEHEYLDGVLFTGSSQVGLKIQESIIKYPHRIIALEMGGNNPLIVGNLQGKLDAAVYNTIHSAFITSGQRCTCSRRLIVVDTPENKAFLEKLIEATGNITVGPGDSNPQPFMGPMISMNAARKALQQASDIISAGGRWLVTSVRDSEDKPFIKPGIIDVTGTSVIDEEIFGPIIQVHWVSDIQSALNEANHTRYGLSASLLSEDKEEYEYYYQNIRAGIVNWNKPTTGASAEAPFGGVGVSGNHRPAGFYACDYASFPVASMEIRELVLPDKDKQSPGL